MARRSGLLERVKRLEERRKSRPLPRIVLAMRGTIDGHIIGYAGNGVSVLRGDNEAAADCAARCFQLTGAAMLQTLYSAEGRQSAASAEDALSPIPSRPEPVAASDGPENEPSDPFALAGIGRKASRAELERFGAIPIPAERHLN